MCFCLQLVILMTFVLSSCGLGVNQDISKNLKHYETLSSSDFSHSIVKRGADPTRFVSFTLIRYLQVVLLHFSKIIGLGEGLQISNSSTSKKYKNLKKS